MNRDIFQGDWNIVKGKVKENWGNLTDDDVAEIRGRRDQLVGKLQKRYGYNEEEAEQEVVDWEDSCDTCDDEESTQKETYFNKGI